MLTWIIVKCKSLLEIMFRRVDRFMRPQQSRDELSAVALLANASEAVIPDDTDRIQMNNSDVNIFCEFRPCHHQSAGWHPTETRTKA